MLINYRSAVIAKKCAITILALLAACSTKKNVSDNGFVNRRNTTGLIFQSSFENGSKVIAVGNNSDIVGKDMSLRKKNDWVNDLEKEQSADFRIEYTGGDISKRYVDIIAEPGNPSNHVLHFWLNDSWLASEHQQKARVQADIYSIRPGYKEFYQSVKVFLTDDFSLLRKYPDKINWLTISEFWNNEWWVATEKYGFRVTLGIGKHIAGEDDLYFILNAENPGQKQVWKADDMNVKVPIGKWFTMDYYFKEGDKNTGRFYMAITPEDGKKQVVFDVKNFTQNTNDPKPNGLTGYNPMKLYTSKEVVSFVKSHNSTLQIYWDDFKLWKNKKPVD
ncbi:hypothetical protein ACVWYN_001299 [Pedobacter sp. UYP24]